MLSLTRYKSKSKAVPDKPLLNLRGVDLYWAISLVLVGILAAEVHASHPGLLPWLRVDDRGSLGAEYDAISQAIYRGDGFSDPFRAGTATTAWMPPLYPYLLTCFHWCMGGDRSSVVYLVLLLQGVAAVATALIVISESRRLNMVGFGYCLVLIFFFANFRDLFQQTHDIWLIMLLISIAWIGFTRWPTAPRSILVSLLWGVFGGLAALASPVIGTAWAVLTGIRWFPRSERIRLRSYAPVLTSAFISIVIVTPWTIRNYLAYGKLLPIKSNGMYELWQAQCSDDDGVWDEGIAKLHPYECDGHERQLYLTLGEMMFMKVRGEEAKKSIARAPREYLRRVTNRFVAATILYHPFRAVEREWFWLFTGKCVVYSLPWVLLGVWAALAIVTRHEVTLSNQFWLTFSLLLLALLPYVMINFYARYAVPLIGLKMLLTIYAIDQLRAILTFRYSFWTHKTAIAS